MIKSNVESLQDSEIDDMIAEADRLANQGVVDRSNGILLQCTEQDGNRYYLVQRLYQ